MSSKKSSMTPILIGGGLIAIYLATKPKTKTSSSTTPKDDVPSLPPNPDITPQIPADLTQKEKAYVDWYYNLGMYKLAQIDTNQIFKMPPEYVAELSVKGNQSDPDWLTSLSYWALYSAPGNESNTTAPWKITDPTSQWNNVWQRMNAYAKTKFTK